MPNSKVPIQRANSTWEPKASAALNTRMRNTVPARRCTSMCSASSRRVLSCDQEPSRDGRAASSESVSATLEPPPVAAAVPTARPWELSPSKEPLTFGWTAGWDLGRRRRHNGVGRAARGRKSYAEAHIGAALRRGCRLFGNARWGTARALPHAHHRDRGGLWPGRLDRPGG